VAHRPGCCQPTQGALTLLRLLLLHLLLLGLALLMGGLLLAHPPRRQ
jgi:hypothetical protein